jgi:hypothetical protein
VTRRAQAGADVIICGQVASTAVGASGPTDRARWATPRRPAVTTFLSPGYLKSKTTQIERDAGVPVTGPEETVRQVAKAAMLSDEIADAILGRFILGGQLTVGGVMQAVTSVAQTIDDADVASDLEAQALRVMDLAAQM